MGDDRDASAAKRVMARRPSGWTPEKQHPNYAADWMTYGNSIGDGAMIKVVRSNLTKTEMKDIDDKRKAKRRIVELRNIKKLATKKA